MSNMQVPIRMLRKRSEIQHAETSTTRKRVAAYCRVSTELEAQWNSLEVQVSASRALISSNPDWELVDIYVDEGLSGTKAANRTAFQQMIADCEAGKVDYIITKSISRFARNTLECLSYVRMLKNMGVFILFEKENLDTGNAASEVLLSILAAVAQEESHNISENLKWGYRKRFEAGIPKWVQLYGYTRGEFGEYVIVQTQGEVVKRIFDMYASGISLPGIICELDKLGIKSMRDYSWTPTTIARILSNERYVGDVLMQKYYIIDHISHKRVKNDQTVVPSYYLKDHHIPIIDRETFDQVQVVRSLKDRHKGSTQYPYYGKIYCPICGEKMIRYLAPFHGHPPAWTCGGSKDNHACQPYCIKQRYIDEAVLEAYRSIDMEKLQKQAHKRTPAIADSAKKALAFIEQHRTLTKVEYNMLDTLYEKITFKKWVTIVFTWKCGLKTTTPVHYSGNDDRPTSKGEHIISNRPVHLTMNEEVQEFRPHIYSWDSVASCQNRQKEV